MEAVYRNLERGDMDNIYKVKTTITAVNDGGGKYSFFMAVSSKSAEDRAIEKFLKEYDFLFRYIPIGGKRDYIIEAEEEKGKLKNLRYTEVYNEQ